MRHLNPISDPYSSLYLPIYRGSLDDTQEQYKTV